MAGLWGLAFTGFPYAIALRTGNPTAVNNAFLLFFPFAFLTTAYLPQESMTGWLATATKFNPTTYLLEGMRALLQEGWDWAPIGRALLAMRESARLVQSRLRRAHAAGSNGTEVAEWGRHGAEHRDRSAGAISMSRPRRPPLTKIESNSTQVSSTPPATPASDRTG